MSEDIDFVVIWVDGNDPEWRREYAKYKPGAKAEQNDTRDIRFRDWGNLKYWFRGVEKFAPWVRTVHFVTCGHYPSWLNMNAPKLNFVKHPDYIPWQYLPVFNCNPIEVNLHRIQGLSEQFVYFNDDTFLIKPVKPERFFKNGLSCDLAALNANSTNESVHIVYNDLHIINRNFIKKAVFSKAFFKWYNPKYGKAMLRTIALSPWPHFTGFVDPHLPNGFFKSTFEKVWSIAEAKLWETTSHRFRDISDVNQYLFRYWQLMESKFYPYNVYKDSIAIDIEDVNLDKIDMVIRNQKKAVLCINDTEQTDFEKAKRQINNAFASILPEKSSFEL